MHLVDQVLDVVAVPGTSDGGTNETGCTIFQNHSKLLRLEGAPQDTNYKVKWKTSTCDIWSTTDLQDQLEDLEGGAEDILKYTKGNLKVVLINEGYKYDVAAT
jgi:hypothetical protein